MDTQGDATLAVPAICAFEVLRGTARAGEDYFDRAPGCLRTVTVLDLDVEFYDEQ